MVVVTRSVREMEFCREQGVKVVRIPVKLGGWPTSEDIRKFLEVVQDKQNQPAHPIVIDKLWESAVQMSLREWVGLSRPKNEVCAGIRVGSRRRWIFSRLHYKFTDAINKIAACAHKQMAKTTFNAFF